MFEVVSGGPQTTVQDAGRRGQLRYGIPPSGPVDARSFTLANRLVGNADGEAALEFTLVGPRLRVEAPCTAAVTGAAAPVTVNDAPAPAWTTLTVAAGDVLRIGPARAGVRGYVAFAGGIASASSCSRTACHWRWCVTAVRSSPAFGFVGPWHEMQYVCRKGCTASRYWRSRSAAGCDATGRKATAVNSSPRAANVMRMGSASRGGTNS